jgi:hypothetical protein
MMPLAVLFAIFSSLGLFVALLGHAAKQNTPAPSMVTNTVSPLGYTVFVVCGLIALAAYASH